MKKIIALLIVTTMLLSIGIIAHATTPVGAVIGTAYNTDIVAYINHYAIPSYAVNGTSVIVAEDLRNFGFDVVWNGTNRSLSIKKSKQVHINEMTFSKTGATGSKFTNILSTDIAVYADGKKITSYAMNGYTMIPMEELSVFGECAWVAEERAIKLWIEEVGIRSEQQFIAYNDPSKRYYSGTYKVGIDIQQGSYVLISDDGSGYFSINADANGENILENDIFGQNTYIDLKKGTYIELSSCYAIPYSESMVFNAIDNGYVSGMYKVGKDIPEGTYRLSVVSSGYYAVYDTPYGEILSNDFFYGNNYVSVKKGQYLKLSDCYVEK